MAVQRSRPLALNNLFPSVLQKNYPLALNSHQLMHHPIPSMRILLISHHYHTQMNSKSIMISHQFKTITPENHNHPTIATWTQTIIPLLNPAIATWTQTIIPMGNPLPAINKMQTDSQLVHPLLPKWTDSWKCWHKHPEPTCQPLLPCVPSVPWMLPSPVPTVDCCLVDTLSCSTTLNATDGP